MLAIGPGVAAGARMRRTARRQDFAPAELDQRLIREEARDEGRAGGSHGPGAAGRRDRTGPRCGRRGVKWWEGRWAPGRCPLPARSGWPAPGRSPRARARRPQTRGRARLRLPHAVRHARPERHDLLGRGADRASTSSIPWSGRRRPGSSCPAWPRSGRSTRPRTVHLPTSARTSSFTTARRLPPTPSSSPSTASSTPS